MFIDEINNNYKDDRKLKFYHSFINNLKIYSNCLCVKSCPKTEYDSWDRWKYL